MNYIDYIIIIFVLIGVIEGIFKGFIVEIASLAAFILGIWGAIKFSGIMSDFMVQHWDMQSEYVKTFAFLITFILIIIAVHFIGKLIQFIIRAVSLGFLDRIAGAVFGAIKTLFVLCVIILLLERVQEKFPIISSQATAESRFYQPLSKLSTTAFPFLKDIYNDIQEEINSDDDSDNESEII